MRIQMNVPQWRAAVALMLGAAALTSGAGQAQQKSAKVTRLIAADYAEIQQLYARYAFAYDTGAENGEAYARLFTPDGSFTFPLGDPRCTPECKGHDQLVRLARGRGNKGPLTLTHVTTNIVIEPSPEGATGKAYLALPALESDGQRGGMRVAGLYEDVMVKTTDGWRFKVRAYTPLPNRQQALSRQAGTAPPQR